MIINQKILGLEEGNETFSNKVNAILTSIGLKKDDFSIQNTYVKLKILESKITELKTLAEKGKENLQNNGLQQNDVEKLKTDINEANKNINIIAESLSSALEDNITIIKKEIDGQQAEANNAKTQEVITLGLFELIKGSAGVMRGIMRQHKITTDVTQFVKNQEVQITKYKKIQTNIAGLKTILKQYETILQYARPSSKEAAKDQVQNATPQGKGFVASNQALNQQKSLGQTKIGFGAKEQKANQTRGILSNSRLNQPTNPRATQSSFHSKQPAGAIQAKISASLQGNNQRHAKVGNSVVPNIKPKIIVSQAGSQIQSRLMMQTQNLNNTKGASMPAQSIAKTRPY